MDPILVNVPTRRLRVRRVDEHALATAVSASEKPGWYASIRTGGSVANKYGYPASTEAALAVRAPSGQVVVWMARLPANKVTNGGAADACLLGARALFDRRYTADETRTAAWRVVKTQFVAEAVKRGIGPDFAMAAAVLGADPADLIDAYVV